MLSRRKQYTNTRRLAFGAVVAVALAVVSLFQAVTSPVFAAAPALENIRVRGHVLCGVGERLGGLSRVNATGTWSGLEVDFCGALAVAVFGDRSRVRYRSVSLSDRFRALTSGEIDVLLRGTAQTFSREAELGVRFAGVLLHDGQGFLVKRAVAVSSVLELSGANICVQSGTSAGQGLEDYFGARQMRYRVVANENWESVVKSYVTDECNLLTGDASLLAIERSQLPDPAGHILLPELITQEQLGPMVRQGDDTWFTIVRWTLMALIAAEELGLTSDSIDGARNSGVHAVRRFLGLEATLGQTLGLAPDWTYQIVKQVGHYGEMFDRNLGSGSPFKLPRGLNDLWSRGGMHIPAPFR